MPDDISVSYELDQSGNVSGALQSLLREASLGALLTGLMVLLFLRDWRSSLIVVVTIPFALLAAVVALWGAGQTLNIMTLGGLALAVGILVDEATVAIENIHTHIRSGAPIARARPGRQRRSRGAAAAGDARRGRRLRAVIFHDRRVAVAVRAAVAGGGLFDDRVVPAVELAGAGARRLAAATPITDHDRAPGAASIAGATGSRAHSNGWDPCGACWSWPYAVATVAIVVIVGPRLGREIFPASGAQQFQLRFRAPAGTKFESTERLAGEVLDEIAKAAGPGNVDITLGYVGVQPSSYPDEHDLSVDGRIARRRAAGGAQEGRAGSGSTRSKTSFANALRRAFPSAQFSFEPGDIVGRILNFGAPTPVEVAIAGPDFAAVRAFAARVHGELARIPTLRDLQFEQALDYPAINVEVDRQLAGQLGVTVDQIGRSFAAATSSSRFVAPNYWADPRTGIAFQVQVEIPQPRMTTLDDLRVVPVTAEGASHPLLGDVARIENGTIVGEYDRFNGQRMVSLSANAAGEDLGRVAVRVDEAIARAGAPPRGASVAVRGQIAPMRDTLRNISAGLAGGGRRDLPAAYRELPVGPAGVRGDLDGARRAGRCRAHAAGDADHPQRAVVHGRHHGDRRRRCERHPARDVRRAGARGGRRNILRSPRPERGCGRC